MSTPTNWFETFFQGVTLDLWRRAIPPEQTTAEADFLIQNLKCAPGTHLLDVPCGNGRLTFELANRGYRVAGIDLAEEFIAEARMAAHDGTTAVEFILGDMRNIEGLGVYDGAFCFGNSFGFLEYADMEKFLAGVARALKPGARFLVNTAMAAESVLPDFEEQSCHEMGDIVMTIKERYVAEESCVDSEYIFERNGEIDSRKAKHWIYTVAEIRRMLERAGFEVVSCFGSLKGEAFKLGARELFVVSTVRTPLAC
ncbi:MAG TPA: methyltransferase domain-containing protein [Pyrinomonadaceae bacterium]